MRRRLSWVLAFAASIAIGGCAARGGSRAGDVADHGMLTREQIAANHFNTAYDAVEQLRSNWLRTRGPDSFSQPSEVVVYLDNTRLGGTDRLREIAANTIYFIRFFDGVAATGRWGVGHAAGVIYVSTHPEGMDTAPKMPPALDGGGSGSD